MRETIAVCAVLTILACAGTAHADGISDVNDCNDANKRGDYEAGLALCSRALESGDLSDAGIVVARNNRGIAYNDKGDYDRAIQDFDAAIRLKPDYAKAYYNRGNTYFNKGDYDRAIQDNDAAIRLDPDDGVTYHNRGNAYASKGEYDRALQDYDQAIRLEPDSAEAYFNRGNAYFNKRDYGLAVQDYEQSVRLKAEFAGDAAWYQGEALFYLARFEEAAVAFDRSVEAEPTDAYGPLWLYLAKLHARQDGATVLAASIENVDLAKWPGPVIRYYQGEISKGALLEAAADAEPPTAKDQACEAAFYIGESDLLAGRSAEARRSFQQAIEICPKDFVEFNGAQAALNRL